MKQIEYHETFSVREMIAQIIVELSHVWMVRTFVKHSEEAEEMPELMAIPRVLFDCIRSIEEWKEDPARLLRQLQKRLRHLKEAHGELERIVQESIDHTNFR